MKRRHLSRLQRVKIFDKARGRCCVCGQKIHAERGDKWEPHHLKPLWLGGADEPWNMAPAHDTPCHQGVSDADNTDRAKTDRQRANHLGVPKPGKAKFACGRDSGKRKKVCGEVVPRVSQASEHRRVMAEREIR